MEQRDIEKFRKHMGLGKTMKIKNQDGTEDEFYFKPLGCQFLPDFMLLATLLDYSGSQKAELREMKNKVKVGKSTKEELDRKYDLFDDLNSQKMLEGNNATLIVSLVEEMVTNSYPELDDETKKAFILNNFSSLQTVLFELNEGAKSEVDDKVLKKIEQVKAARRNA